MPEPGDIVEMTSMGVRHVVFIIKPTMDEQSRACFMLVRRLVDGTLDICDPESCSMMVKRYHVLADMTVDEIENQLYKTYHRIHVMKDGAF